MLFYLPEMSTRGARTSGKCWSATRSSSGLRNVGKTTPSSERAFQFLPLKIWLIVQIIVSDPVILRHDVVITFDDEVYDMVLLGKFPADCSDALSLGGLSQESIRTVRLAMFLL